MILDAVADRAPTGTDGSPVEPRRRSVIELC